MEIATRPSGRSIRKNIIGLAAAWMLPLLAAGIPAVAESPAEIVMPVGDVPCVQEVTLPAITLRAGERAILSFDARTLTGPNGG